MALSVIYIVTLAQVEHTTFILRTQKEPDTSRGCLTLERIGSKEGAYLAHHRWLQSNSKTRVKMVGGR